MTSSLRTVRYACRQINEASVGMGTERERGSLKVIFADAVTKAIYPNWSQLASRSEKALDTTTSTIPHHACYLQHPNPTAPFTSRARPPSPSTRVRMSWYVLVDMRGADEILRSSPGRCQRHYGTCQRRHRYAIGDHGGQLFCRCESVVIVLRGTLSASPYRPHAAVATPPSSHGGCQQR